MFKIFRQFKQISINNQQKKGLCSKLLLLSLFLFGHSISVSLSDELFQLRGSFKLMYTWVLPDNKKKFKIFAHMQSFFKGYTFFQVKKRTLKSLRMFSIYGFYSIHGFRENISGFSQILTGFKPVSDSVSDLVSDSGFDRSIQFIHGIIQSAPVFSNTRFRFRIGFEVLFCRFKNFNESIYIFIKCVVISLCLSLQQQQKFSLNTSYSRARTLFYVFLRRLWTGSSVCQI